MNLRVRPQCTLPPYGAQLGLAATLGSNEAESDQLALGHGQPLRV
jgi:hypothetical protein